MLPAGASAQRFAWWRDADIQQELQLTPGQITDIERAQQESLEGRRSLRQELERADAEMARALERGDLDDATALELVTRVETIRMRSNVARSLVLARMYRVLSPEQRRLLSALRERAVRN